MKKFRLDKVGILLKTTFKKWWERNPYNESAIIAYNAIFSLPGLLVVVITLAGYFFGADAVSGKLHTQIAQAMGSETADQIQNMVRIANKGSESVWIGAFVTSLLFVLANQIVFW